MYRQALAAAAAARNWPVHWYDAKTLPLDALEPRFRELRRTLGPPWDKDHELAMAAALSGFLCGLGVFA
jgi:hypothetical protein